MAASLDDILTTQKNGVIAINNLAQYLLGISTFMKGASLSSGSAGTGTYGTLYTVPANKQVAISDIEICNTGSTAATFYVSLVPSGGTAGASNALFYNAPIPPYTTVQWTGLQALGAGATVQAYASTSNVTILVSGNP
jgi:hypothetical protein